MGNFCHGKGLQLAEPLLPLLAPVSARAWICPFFEVKFDMGWVIRVLTSNSSSLLPQPLLSRCPPTRRRALTLDELVAFARCQGARRDLSEVSIAVIAQALQGAARPEQLSLRTVLRMIERGRSLEGRRMASALKRKKLHAQVAQIALIDAADDAAATSDLLTLLYRAGVGMGQDHGPALARGAMLAHDQPGTVWAWIRDARDEIEQLNHLTASDRTGTRP